MSFSMKAPALVAFLLVLCQLCLSEVLVQLNVNRPFNDVNEKFVSFALKPDDLYKALDGDNRKTLTRMAALLGDSYVKFVGDFYFAADTEKKLRNPTKVIWKGFNRWTRAVNWTMIIPVPYSTTSWDPMDALNILNTSFSVGITDCIWQLGTDFGSTQAKDYVTELKTLNLMVDSFRPSVDDWQIIGADISAGSSADETRRYIDMSKDLNAAFGWRQTTDAVNSNSLSSHIYSNDPALRVLMSKKVPIWLALPTTSRNKRSKTSTEDEVADALYWAQAMGDAASAGFDTIFKRMSLDELETPKPSFYVTTLFKKVMGSRVFHAKSMSLFGRSNKLYTHCANSISGGMAFMVVNTADEPVEITIRSLTQLKVDEVWQYTLTFKNGDVLLNNEKINVNSTMRPIKKLKNVIKPIQISTPSRSVSFWVLPSANLEHCQYTEIEAEELKEDNSFVESAKDEKYSSSDRLLKKLIQESALPQGILAKLLNRARRDAMPTSGSSRRKRFILEDPHEKNQGWGNLLDAFTLADKPLRKRASDLTETGNIALEWLRNFMVNPLDIETHVLGRGRRSADNYFEPLFGNKEGKQNSFTRKIFDIRRPERKVKPLFDMDEFDEEKFFKKINEETVPDYMRLPEGDVHMKHISTLDGEEIEENKELYKKPTKKAKATSKEVVPEAKAMRLLPTEFYEALPFNGFKVGSKKMSLGSALNSLLFPEPFKKYEKNNAKLKADKETSADSDSPPETEEPGKEKSQKENKLADEFLNAQKELRKAFFSDNKKWSDKSEEESDKKKMEKRKLIKFLVENLESYLTGKAKLTSDKEEEPQETTEATNDLNDEVNWWELSSIRKKRALMMPTSDNLWRYNTITKDDDLMPLGAAPPEKLAPFDNKIHAAPQTQPEEKPESMSQKLVSSMRKNVSYFMDALARHVTGWVNTLAKHIEPESTTIAPNRK